MKLIIAEKNDAARQIAERLSTGKPKKDKVYNTAIYRFEWKGEECVTIGLAGHILAPDFCDSVLFDKKLGWYSVTEDGEMLAAALRHQAQAVSCRWHLNQGLETREPALPHLGARH